MPVMLDEEMMGRDDTIIGFPHLLLCIGVVLVTGNELWGVHISSQATAQQVFNAFWGYCTGRGLAVGAVTAVYGGCNWNVRYGPPNQPATRQAWEAEMTGFANHMGYHGAVRGFDFSIIAPKDGAYMEYRRQIGGTQPCRIFYKRHEKTVRAAATHTPLAGNADVVSYSIRNGNFRLLALPSSGITGKVSTFHSGVMHEVDYALRLVQFNV